MPRCEESMFEEFRHHIGGRPTDVQEIAYSLEYMVKNHFPVNEVPKKICTFLDKLNEIMESASTVYQETIDMIVEELNQKEEYP